MISFFQESTNVSRELRIPEFTWKFLYDVPQFERVFIDTSILTATNGDDLMAKILKFGVPKSKEKKPEKLTFRVNFSKAKTDLRELLEVEDYVMLRDVEASEEKKHPIAFYVLFTGEDAEKFYSILDLKSKLPKKLMEQVGVHFVVDKMKSLPRGEIEYILLCHTNSHVSVIFLQLYSLYH